MEEEKYSISVEWYDEISSLVRPFTLFYFPSDRTVEMVCLVGGKQNSHNSISCFFSVWQQTKEDIFEEIFLWYSFWNGFVHWQYYYCVWEGFEIDRVYEWHHQEWINEEIWKVCYWNAIFCITFLTFDTFHQNVCYAKTRGYWKDGPNVGVYWRKGISIQ